MAKKNLTFWCSDCDDEFTVKLDEAQRDMSFYHCVFCGEQIENEEYDDDLDEEELDDSNY